MDDIYFLMRIKNADVYIKRDDLLPFSFGGNKLRIVRKAFEDMKKKGCDEFISYGSESSNLNRVAAHMARAEGTACTVIFKRGRRALEPFNERMVKESGARIVYCDGSEVRQAVEIELERAEREHRKPYYIYGGADGKGNEACLMEAYADAYEEIKAYEEKRDIRFSHIFLASGTGITQAGLMAGTILHKDDKRIWGISVARSSSRSGEIIREDLELYMKGRAFDRSHLSDIIVDDRFVMGGYGDGSKELSLLCREMLSAHGLPLDPIYTGKAFLGMRTVIEEEDLRGSLLFIHTGGLPGVFDAACGSMLS